MKLRDLILIFGLAPTLVLSGCDKGKESDGKAADTKEADTKEEAKGPSVSLDKAEYAAGDTIKVSFGASLPASGDKYWLTLVKDGSPDSEWGAWHMVKSGASSDSLKATEGGKFEVRLHDSYPKKSNHIVARKKVTVSGEASLLSLDKSSFSKGDTIAVKFAKALPADEDKYWLTLVKADSPETTWGKWHMVEKGATADKLEAAEKGRFEVRLHSNYPTKKHNMVASKPVTIE
jgi:uncharacterized protein YfaS (alpha-2-macroglobulin family)